MVKCKKRRVSISYICSMETTIAAPVSFTQSATDEIRRLMSEQGFDTSTALRVGVKGGGCSGLSYLLGFDHQKEEDEVYEMDGFGCAESGVLPHRPGLAPVHICLNTPGKGKCAG